MRRSARRRLQIIALVGLLGVAAAAAVWVGAVQRWIAQELRALAGAYLNPTLSFDGLTYTFPRTLTLRGVRLTSSDPRSTAGAIDILAIDSVSLTLSEVPRPDAPFRVQQLDLVAPTLRLVRTPAGGESDGLLGFSDLLKDGSAPGSRPPRAATRLSDVFQVDEASIEGGRILFDPRDGDPSLLIDRLTAKLLVRPGDAGSYGIDFSLDHPPALALAMRGQLLADEKRLEVSALSSTLQLAREYDHYLTPAMQKLLAARDVTGRLTFEASGSLDFSDADRSHLQVDFELADASYATGGYGLTLDHVRSRISAVGKTATLEELAIVALGGNAAIAGTVELDDSLTAALSFEGAELQVGDLLRGVDDSGGVPSFSGLLDFSGTVRGALADIQERAEGEGRLSLREARLARLPVLATIDEAIDRAAEAALKREHKGRDALSLRFSLEGDRARISKLRMNSRWYGLRGHGDVDFDSRLDLAVDGGPVPRVENELGALGDVLGEITETLVRARVTGTLAEPKVAIEVLRHSLRRR